MTSENMAPPGGAASFRQFIIQHRIQRLIGADARLVAGGALWRAEM